MVEPCGRHEIGVRGRLRLAIERMVESLRRRRTPSPLGGTSSTAQAPVTAAPVPAQVPVTEPPAAEPLVAALRAALEAERGRTEALGRTIARQSIELAHLRDLLRRAEVDAADVSHRVEARVVASARCRNPRPSVEVEAIDLRDPTSAWWCERLQATAGPDAEGCAAAGDSPFAPTLISIVAVAEDGLDELADVVASACAQDVATWELILVDASGDPLVGGTDDARIQVIDGHRGGSAVGRAKALERVAGTYVLFVDGDTPLVPGWLAAVARAAQSAPGTDVFAGVVASAATPSRGSEVCSGPVDPLEAWRRDDGTVDGLASLVASGRAILRGPARRGALVTRLSSPAAMRLAAGCDPADVAASAYGIDRVAVTTAGPVVGSTRSTPPLVATSGADRVSARSERAVAAH